MGEKITIVRTSLLWIQVCAPIGMDHGEIERQTNAKSPTAISTDWGIHAEQMPGYPPTVHPCDDDTDRQHWVLWC